MLYKKDYVQKDPEEFLVEKEQEIRKTIMKVYNRKRKDFATDDEYDVYLEDIEDKISVLTDVESTDEKKQFIKEVIRLERTKNTQRIANSNAHVEEQLKLFKQVVECHQKSYKNYTLLNSVAFKKE